MKREVRSRRSRVERGKRDHGSDRYEVSSWNKAMRSRK